MLSFPKPNSTPVSQPRHRAHSNILTRAKVRRVYRWYAPVYDLVFGRALDAGRARLANSPALRRSRRILEVGVGTGRALPLYPRGALVLGLDLSCEMLRHAQRRIDEQRLADAHLLCADAEQLPFATACFDCVTVPYVLSVTPNPSALLAELRRICIPGGTILILNHFRGSRGWRWAEDLLRPMAGHIGFDSALDLEATLAHPDWEIVDVQSVNLLGLSRLVQLRNAPRVS